MPANRLSGDQESVIHYLMEVNSESFSVTSPSPITIVLIERLHDAPPADDPEKMLILNDRQVAIMVMGEN